MADERDLEDFEENIETITLEFEDGHAEEFEVVGFFAHEDASYIALLPLEDDGDEPFVYLYACTEEDDGSLTIFEIEDDELFEAVSATFDELLGGYADDEDGEE